MGHLSATQQAIVATLMASAHPRGARLQDIVKAVGLAHPTVLRHLQALAARGLIEATLVAPRETRYLARRTFDAMWIDPGRHRIESWTSHAPLDWRFPLVARIPDPPAQGFLLKWLRRLSTEGLLQDPIHIVVYGSCARGDATPRSDVDLLVILASNAPRASRIELTAAEAAPGTGRSPDLRLFTWQKWRKSDAAFRATARAEGKTVFCNPPDDVFLEDRHDDVS